MRLIDCAHDAGISATLAVELADMVSPKTAWICSPENPDQQQLEGGGAVGPAAATTAEAAGTSAPAARGGLVAVLEDRFPQGPSPSGELCRAWNAVQNPTLFSRNKITFTRLRRFFFIIARFLNQKKMKVQ